MGKVGVVATDYCFGNDAIGEHGLTILIETKEGKLLFDTGQGLALGYNLAALGWNLSGLECIAISHGHNDHTGGLLEALKLCGDREIPVYGHKDIFAERFKVSPKGEAPTGCPFTREELEATGARFIFNDKPLELLPGIMLTGPIQRGFSEPAGKSHFIVENKQRVPDPFRDDQALVLTTKKGIVIIYGCAHAGVINTMDHVEKITGEKKFYALLGGTHLLQADQGVLEKTLGQIEKRGVEVLGFTHCTGLNAIAYFNTHFSGKNYDASTGFSIEI